LREAGETSRQIDNHELDAARLGGTLPREQHSQRGRGELHERRALGDTLTMVKRRDCR